MWLHAQNLCLAVIAEGIVFVSAGKGSAGREAAAVRLPDVTKGEKPEIVYRTEKQLPYVPTPVVVDDAFILWNDAGIVTSIDAKTGKANWKGRAGGSYFSSPPSIDGKIYNISRQGDWVAMATDRFKSSPTLELPEGALDAGGRRQPDLHPDVWKAGLHRQVRLLC